jgi:hydroxymethylpyrimidine pyrophosphatase-like HAD family hydrolase
MLRWVSHGVAMANAHIDVKFVANEVTASNDDDGVAIILERELA